MYLPFPCPLSLSSGPTILTPNAYAPGKAMTPALLPPSTYLHTPPLASHLLPSRQPKSPSVPPRQHLKPTNTRPLVPPSVSPQSSQPPSSHPNVPSTLWGPVTPSPGADNSAGKANAGPNGNADADVKLPNSESDAVELHLKGTHARPDTSCSTAHASKESTGSDGTIETAHGPSPHTDSTIPPNAAHPRPTQTNDGSLGVSPFGGQAYQSALVEQDRCHSAVPGRVLGKIQKPVLDEERGTTHDRVDVLCGSLNCSPKPQRSTTFSEKVWTSDSLPTGTGMHGMPKITWVHMQHAWALGGLPRVHHPPRFGVHGEK